MIRIDRFYARGRFADVSKEITRLEMGRGGRKEREDREKERERKRDGLGESWGGKGWDWRAQSNAIRHANEKRDGVSWRQEVRMGQ